MTMIESSQHIPDNFEDILSVIYGKKITLDFPKAKPQVATSNQSENRGGWQLNKNYEGEGIYLGLLIQPDGVPKNFDVFVAPFNKVSNGDIPFTLRGLEQSKTFLDRSVINYEDERALYKSLIRGEYDGGWFLPPIHILGDGIKQILPHGTIYDNANNGAFSGTFNRVANRKTDYYLALRRSVKDQGYPVYDFNSARTLSPAGGDCDVSMRFIRLKQRMIK